MNRIQTLSIAAAAILGTVLPVSFIGCGESPTQPGPGAYVELPVAGAASNVTTT